jgi:adenosylmethionine-8-amino-7-oxononanoate aminotransferase
MTSSTATKARLRNDLDAYWMPFTANRAFQRNPRILVSAKGIHYFTAEGRPILDGMGGPLGRERRSLPRSYCRSHQSASWRARFFADVSIRSSKSLFPGKPDCPRGTRRFAAMDRAFRDFDLRLRAAGDTLILAPPLIVSEAQIGEIVEKTTRTITAVA